MGGEGSSEGSRHGWMVVGRSTQMAGVGKKDRGEGEGRLRFSLGGGMAEAKYKGWKRG